MHELRTVAARRGTAVIDSLGRVEIDPRAMPTAELQAYRFDPSDGLDTTEVAMLAVAHNPDLRLARDDLGIARAQAFAAGLLPDPQVGIESDYPAPGPAGATRAFTYGLSIDMMAILQRGDNLRAADATAAKTDLGLLWQEWQVIAQARQLFAKAVYLDEVMPLFTRQHDLNAARYRRVAAAFAVHEQQADSLGAALIAMQDADKQLADTQRQRVQVRHDLNALLGVAPSVDLPLTASSTPAPVDPHAVEDALHELPRRRPDLLALEAGYAAQEAKYRGAILAQFPNLTVGFVRTRDTSNVYTSGFQVNLSLPIFNRNRGNVEIEQTVSVPYAARLLHWRVARGQAITRGMPLLAAGRNRLRPIAMTTIAAILALLPLAFALGQGSAMQQPLAIAIVSGLIVQLPLVLVALPVLLGWILSDRAR